MYFVSYLANIESKLSDIEQALEYISMNSSRSHTPADDLSRTNTPTPRSSSMTGSCERFPVGTGYKVSDINIEEEKDDSFKFKPNILPNSKSEANITSRERNSREITLGNRSPREVTLGNRSPKEVTLGNRSPREEVFRWPDEDSDFEDFRSCFSFRGFSSYLLLLDELELLVGRVS
jgi:hypothetical protein